MRRAVLVLLLAAACRDDAPPSDVRGVQTTATAAVAAAGRSANVLITPHAGAAGLDTARVLMVGPPTSTAGSAPWQVSYATSVSLGDSVALATQADSIFERIRPIRAQRPDTTIVLDARVSAGGSYRFLYRRLPGGTWERVN